MTVSVLGISGFYHDSAAAIVTDGELVAAAQEERFTRKRHDSRFPRHAINYCLGEAYIEPSDLACVVFYDNSLLTLDRSIRSIVANAPASRSQWMDAAHSIFGRKLHVRSILRDILKVDRPTYFCRHHLSHAASAFYPSAFERAAILTIDGVGEWATTSIAHGQGSRISVLKEIHYPNSLGLLYSAFTQFCGFKVNSGEYKLMGLAPYGTPVHERKILDHLFELRLDGSFRLNTEYFGFLDSTSMTNERFNQLFGGPARKPESPITRREMDLAASIQRVTEEAVLRLARHARECTGEENLSLAGGVALNCVANGLLEKSRIFKRIWIQPAAGDAGGAVGAALAASHKLLGVPRKPDGKGHDGQKGSYLGPAFSSEEVRAFLDRNGYQYRRIENADERASVIAGILADGKIVGFFSGRMEFGPRALGARSILGDPRNPEIQVLMNVKIKFRESFRPFAPAVIESRTREYFDLESSSPYMLLVAPVRKEIRVPMDLAQFQGGNDDLLPVVRQVRSSVPAVTHVDYSARLQTVGPEFHPEFYRVISAFDRLTGCPLVVNTSFNVRGEPIVCSPADAYRCFMRTGMDLLVLEDCVLEKNAQPRSHEIDRDWLKEYELD